MNTKRTVPINDIANSIISSRMNPIDEKICILVYQITQERKNQHLTQSELAKMSGLTKNTISRIETLNTLPSLSALIQIADSLNLDLSLKKK